MERTIRVFKSSVEAEDADKEYYRSLSFVELLNALNVRFLVVGAFAVAYHGYPR